MVAGKLREHNWLKDKDHVPWTPQCAVIFLNYVHLAEHTKVTGHQFKVKYYLISGGIAQSASCLSYGKSYTWLDSRQVKRCYIPLMSQPCLGPTQPPTQWERGPFAWGKTGRGGEDYRSTPPRAEAKNEWRYISNPKHDSIACTRTSLTLSLRFLIPLMKSDWRV